MVNIIVYGEYINNKSMYKYLILDENNNIIDYKSHTYSIKKSKGKLPTIVAKGIYSSLLSCQNIDNVNIICNYDVNYLLEKKYDYFNFLYDVLDKIKYTIIYNENTKDLIEEYTGKNEDIYKIYVDGSYNKNTKYYGWAYIVCYKDNIIKYDYGKDNIASDIWQVAGELSATMRALEYCVDNNIKNVCIYYDYKGIEEWAIEKWGAKNKWTKMYVNFIKEYKRYIGINFSKVKAHSKNKYNDLADHYAKIGCGI